MSNIRVCLNSPQGSRFGNILRRFYMGGKHEDLLEMAPGRSGYPYNGGEHTLTIFGEVGEVKAWLNLFKETFPDGEKEINCVLHEIVVNPTNQVIELRRLKVVCVLVNGTMASDVEVYNWFEVNYD